jgi:hypothetical protein
VKKNQWLKIVAKARLLKTVVQCWSTNQVMK